MIGAIFATDESWGFGNKGKMPWPANKDDFAHFKKLTYGSKIVMGRKTFDSLPSVLSGRQHIVISSDLSYDNPNVEVYRSIPEALNAIGNSFWVIGGANILEQFKYITDFDVLYHTLIDGKYDCDVTLDVNKITEGMIIRDTLVKSGCKILKYTH